MAWETTTVETPKGRRVEIDCSQYSGESTMHVTASLGSVRISRSGVKDQAADLVTDVLKDIDDLLDLMEPRSMKVKKES